MTLKHTLFLLLFHTALAGAVAQTAGSGEQPAENQAAPPPAQTDVLKAKADSAYIRKDYSLAAKLYGQLLAAGTNADVHYNLANAFYRMTDYPQAILHYERCLKLEPGHADAAYNLDVCRTKASVPSGQPAEMFFITWFNRLVGSRSVDGWGNSALCFLALALVAWWVFRLSGRLWVRKGGFALMCAGLLLAFFSTVAAALQNSRFRNETKAVVMAEAPLSAEGVKGTPYLLVPGTTVTVLDESPDGRLFVETSDKLYSGWVDGERLAKV